MGIVRAETRPYTTEVPVGNRSRRVGARAAGFGLQASGFGLQASGFGPRSGSEARGRRPEAPGPTGVQDLFFDPSKGIMQGRAVPQGREARIPGRLPAGCRT